MANTLGINLQVGDKLVMVDGSTATVCEPLMFGAMNFTAGSALIVEQGGVRFRTSGYDIDAPATRSKFSNENGW